MRLKHQPGTGTDCVVVSVALFAAAAIRSANAEGGAQVCPHMGRAGDLRTRWSA